MRGSSHPLTDWAVRTTLGVMGRALTIPCGEEVGCDALVGSSVENLQNLGLQDEHL